MRGADGQSGKLFSYLSPESLVPQEHPLRAIRLLVNAALERLSPAFAAIYADSGRPSIPPEKLLRALLLQALFTVRSERQLMQQITYNMLFRWFVGLAMDAPVWDVTVFTKNRDRLLEGDIARGFLAAILADPQVTALLSSEHFSVVGDLPAGGRITLGGDKAYDTQDFVAEMRRLGVTPHVSQNTKGRRSAIDGRTTRHAGYVASVRVRKRIEEVFGWIKTVAGLRKTRHRGTTRVGWMFTFAAAAYNLVRIPKLLAGAAYTMLGLCP